MAALDGMLELRREAYESQLETARGRDSAISMGIDEFGRETFSKVESDEAKTAEANIKAIDEARDTIRELGKYTRELQRKGYAPPKAWK